MEKILKEKKQIEATIDIYVVLLRCFLFFYFDETQDFVVLFSQFDETQDFVVPFFYVDDFVFLFQFSWNPVVFPFF